MPINRPVQRLGFIHLSNMLGRKRTYGPQRSRSMQKKKAKTFTRLPSIANKTMLARGQYTKVVLKYCEQFNLNPGIGGTADNYVFSANGVYDPNITGGGHQPAGFDQYMALYEKFTVTKSTIKCVFSNTDQQNTGHAIIGIINRDLNLALTDPRVYIENGACKWEVLNIRGTGTGVKTITQAMNIADFATNKIMDDDTFSGSDAANPAENLYYYVFAAPADASTDLGSINCVVEISYEVYFRQPRSIGLS
jgi:hypothetical protein